MCNYTEDPHSGVEAESTDDHQTGQSSKLIIPMAIAPPCSGASSENLQPDQTQQHLTYSTTPKRTGITCRYKFNEAKGLNSQSQKIVHTFKIRAKKKKSTKTCKHFFKS